MTMAQIHSGLKTEVSPSERQVKLLVKEICEKMGRMRKSGRPQAVSKSFINAVRRQAQEVVSRMILDRVTSQSGYGRLT